MAEQSGDRSIEELAQAEADRKEVNRILGVVIVRLLRRVDALEAKLVEQDDLYQKIAATLIDKVEPRLRSLESRPGPPRIEPGAN